MPELIEFAKAAAIHAGDLIVRERQQNSLQHDFKNGNELVTQGETVDKAFEFFLRRK